MWLKVTVSSIFAVFSFCTCLKFGSWPQVADIQGDVYHLKQSLYSELRVSK